MTRDRSFRNTREHPAHSRVIITLIKSCLFLPLPSAPGQKRRHNVLPIVMGAHPTDYAQSAPYRSYIHVDEFESPKELAEYLHRLDRDDELYNSYFRWKGTGEFINTYFWCRMCAMLHDDRPPKYYKDVNEWWRGDGVCTTSSWRENDLERSQSFRNT